MGIARAVVNRPHIILADEPTGNLDPELSADILTVFEQFSAVGVSILIASHDSALLSQFGHRTLTLDHGKLSFMVNSSRLHSKQGDRRQVSRRPSSTASDSVKLSPGSRTRH